MKVTGLFIDVESNPGRVDEVTLEDNLEEYYKLLNCDIIDIAVRTIGDREFDIVCDDEGLFKENPIPSAIGGKNNAEAMLVGNIFICHHDSEGRLVSIGDDDMIYILKNHIAYLADVKNKHPFAVVMDVNYVSPRAV